MSTTKALTELTTNDLDQQQQLQLQAFVVNHSDRIKQWEESHTKRPAPLPICYDLNLKEFVWMNRNRRRKLKKRSK